MAITLANWQRYFGARGKFSPIILDIDTKIHNVRQQKATAETGGPCMDRSIFIFSCVLQDNV